MKIPTPRKMSSGNWFIRLRLGNNSISVVAPTEKECRDKAALIKAEHRAGKNTISFGADMTLGEMLDKYIASKRDVLSPSTVRGYTTVRRNNFASVMDKRFKDVKSWQSVINAEAKLYSPKTIKNAWRFVCSALKEADVAVPKVVLPQLVPSEHPWLEPDEIKKFIAALEGQPHEIAALLALHSMRRSEILALTWDKIDLKRGTIRISGASVFNEDNKLITKQTNKNASSTRTIPIMIPALRTALEAVENKSGPVVICNANTIWARVNRTCRALDLPEVGVHGLRHSFASLAYHLGWSEQQTMDIGGWSDTTTMHKIYTHLAAADRLKAQNSMAEFYTT